MAIEKPADQNLDDLSASLASRVSEAKRRAGLEEENEAASEPQGSNRGMQSGIEFVAATLTTALLGLGLDQWLDTKPLFMLIGLFLGMGAGIWNLYRVSVGGDDLSIGVKPKAEKPAGMNKE